MVILRDRLIGLTSFHVLFVVVGVNMLGSLVSGVDGTCSPHPWHWQRLGSVDNTEHRFSPSAMDQLPSGKQT